MTINTQTPRIVYIGNSTRGPFSLQDGSGNPIRLRTATDLVLWRYSSTTDAVGEQLVYSTDFTVTNIDPDAATFTLTSAQDALTSSQRIVATREQSVAQNLSLTLGGNFGAVSDMAQRDIVAEQIQELRRDVDRAIKVDWRETAERELPIAPSSGVALLGRSTSGAIVHATAADFGSGTPISSAWLDVLGTLPGEGVAEFLAADLDDDEETLNWNSSNLSSLVIYQSKTFISGNINATTDQITWTDHGFRSGAACIVTAGDGLTANLTRYFIRRVDDDTIQLHTSFAGARANTGKVDITGTTAFTLKVLRDPVGSLGVTGYYRIRSGDALDGSQGAFVREGKAKPEHFGADPESGDATEALQHWLNFCRWSWDATKNHFEHLAIGDDWVYTIDDGLEVVALRQPDFVISDLGLYCTAPGKTALDTAGSNGITQERIIIYGDRDAMPAIGTYVGRLEADGDEPIAPNTTLNNVVIWGYFTRAAMVNAASEDSREIGCRYSNANKNTNAVTKFNFGDMQDVVTVQGSAFTSAHCTLPTAGNDMSNISHWVDLDNCVRNHDSYVVLTGLTKGATTTLTFAANAATASWLEVGDDIFLDLEATSALAALDNDTYEILTINAATGTMTINVDTSAMAGSFTSGNIRNVTGHSVVYGSGRKYSCDDAYYLGYGPIAPVAFVLRNGSLGNVDIECQIENAPQQAIYIYMPTSGTEVVQGFRFRANLWDQPVALHIIGDDGAGGSVRFDGCDIIVDNMAAAPSGKMFETPASFSLYNASIQAALAAGINDPTTFAAFEGRTVAYDRSPNRIQHYGGLTSFGTTSTPALTLQTNDDGATAAPVLALYRNSASPAANDVLTRLDFQGNSSTGVKRNFGQIRGRIQNPANGSEVGFIDLLQIVTGAETVTHQWRSGLYQFLSRYTVATLPNAGAGAVQGGIAYATDLRVFNGAGTQEGAGLGTGGFVEFNGTNWRVFGTNVTAVA